MKSVAFVMVASLFAFGATGQNFSKTDSIKNASLQLTNNTGPLVEFAIPTISPKLILVEAVQGTMSKGLKAGFQVEIPEVTPDQIEKNLENDLRHKTKSKVTKNNNEYSIPGTLLSTISDKPLDVYVVLTKLDSSTRAVYFFEQDSTFISEEVDANKANLSKEYIRTFAINQYKEQTQRRIKSESEKLETLEKELKKLMSQNESMHSDIKSLESNINNASMDVKANEGAQEIKTKEIYRQKELAASIKEKETKKTAEKVLKDLNKDNKKLRDEHESLNQKIVKYRAEIESIKVNVRTNLQDQYLKNQDVSKQRSYLRGVEAMAGKIH